VHGVVASGMAGQEPWLERQTDSTSSYAGRRPALPEGLEWRAEGLVPAGRTADVKPGRSVLGAECGGPSTLGSLRIAWMQVAALLIESFTQDSRADLSVGRVGAEMDVASAARIDLRKRLISECSSLGRRCQAHRVSGADRGAVGRWLGERGITTAGLEIVAGMDRLKLCW
jgi:hypothetical protein